MESLKFVMTTTFYPPYHIGGDAIHVYHLSNELAKRGHEVHIVHSIDSYRWQRKGEPAKEYLNHENVIVHSIESPIGKASPLISYVFGFPYPVAKKIKMIIKDLKPDVIHHHNIAGLGPFIFDVSAPKVLYTAHDYWLACPMDSLMKYNGEFCNDKSNCFICSLLSRRPPQLWRYTDLLKRKLKKINTIITPSEYMKNKLQVLGIKGNFAVIPNFALEPRKTGAPLYNFPYFLFVGVLEEHKGILNLVDAFLKVKNEINAKLLIVGSGSLEDKVKNIISKNECLDKIIVLGMVDDLTLANVYANARAVIIPSTWPENCPLVALEALANGTPIIVSNMGGLPEIASKSMDCKIVKESLASTILNFSSNIKHRVDVKKSHSYFTISEFMNKYKKLY